MAKKDIRILIVSCTIIIILTKVIFHVGFVPSSSMENTIKERSFIVGLRIAREYNRGDIAIFKEDGKYMVKRIVAKGGDEIVLEGNALYINGEKKEEPYLKEEPVYIGLKGIVPKGKYFMMGDNRNNSRDSRYIGTVDEEDITSKCILY